MYGVMGFVLIAVCAAEFLPRLSRKPGVEQAVNKVKPGRFDWLGVVWLLAIPFAPLALWLINSLATVNADNWRSILAVKVFLCVVLPVLCVLPLLRYVRGKAGPWLALILCIGTTFPVCFGWASAVDLIRKPRWESVQITRINRVVMVDRHGHEVRTRTLKVYLGGGRVIEANSDVVSLKKGPANVLILKALGLLIDVRS